jgi:Carboxypeptidase regulatory-like domain
MLKTTVKILLLTIVLSTAVFAQSQALNGQIEGVVSDSNGANVPNATITALNTQTGTTRTVKSDGSGVYRLPLLPLGSYRVTIEATNFKKLVRDGITLTTGQTATIDAELQAGGATETVTIEADSPIADSGKIDVGRVMNSREVESLPLVSRNPYNYSLLQANVTGRPNSEFGVPRINANGYARRTNYQLDGNSNTQADRGGIRLMPISETFVSEVQLVTNGFSAEFGNTPGLIMNAVTPSGTNTIHGSGSYRFRRTPFYARPFQYSLGTDLQKNTADNPVFAIGGPIVKDKWHYYGGYEYVRRDLAVEPNRLVTINAANQTALIAAGLNSAIFPAAIPVSQKANFFLIRTDAQISENNRLSGRFNYFHNNSPNNIGGGANTLQRSIDFIDLSYSAGIQLISTISPNLLNEFRFQYAKRESQNLANSNSGTGPSIVITGIANFGSPENKDTIAPLETTTQFLDNFTWTTGNHTMKFGGGFNRIYDLRKSNVFARYTFDSILNYVSARTGVVQPNATCPVSATKCYTGYTEVFGNPQIEYKSTFYNWFVQDDWKITPKVKLNFGLRYDLYNIPKANSASPFSASQKFNVDKNNFAPRLGIVYGLRDGTYSTIIRASAGLYYDTPALDLYLRALQTNGSPLLFNFNFGPTTAGSPSFPTTFGSLPPGSVLPVQSIDTVSPDFETMYATHSNIQLEQGLTKDISATFGFIHSGGRHLPVYRNINRINPTTFLADGRPVFSGTVSAATRLDPRFNNILMAESVGNSSYNAATFQLTKRFSQGYQFSVNYTLSKSQDDAPEQNLVATQVTNLVSSDPTNRSRDRGLSLADQRHTFVTSAVVKPIFSIENKALNSILNNNQFGLIVTANSGERFNIVSITDRNVDGFIGSDRPVGFARNSGKTPNQFNADLRYSRYFNFSERFKLEVFGEAVNIFNVNSVFQFNNVNVATNADGTLNGPLPEFNSAARGITSLDSRQFQMGFKFKF